MLVQNVINWAPTLTYTFIWFVAILMQLDATFTLASEHYYYPIVTGAYAFIASTIFHFIALSSPFLFLCDLCMRIKVQQYKTNTDFMKEYWFWIPIYIVWIVFSYAIAQNPTLYSSLLFYQFCVSVVVLIGSFMIQKRMRRVANG